MAEILMFPDSFIALQEELSHHPDLMEKMALCEETAFTDRLAYLAGLLGVLVDGYYHYREIENLADILVDKMRERRSLIVLTGQRKEIQIPTQNAVQEFEDINSKLQGDSDDSNDD